MCMEVTVSALHCTCPIYEADTVNEISTFFKLAFNKFVVIAYFEDSLNTRLC